MQNDYKFTAAHTQMTPSPHQSPITNTNQTLPKQTYKHKLTYTIHKLMSQSLGHKLPTTPMTPTLKGNQHIQLHKEGERKREREINTPSK